VAQGSEPFTSTGIAIKTVPGVSFAKLKAQVQTRNFEWDVINLGDVEYAQAVLEGLLEKVDKAAAKTDQLPPHMVRDFGITSYSLGTNLVYRKDKFPNGGPQSWADFWDVKKFPGPRCSTPFLHLPRLCAAADGVPPDSRPWISTAPSARYRDRLSEGWWRQRSQSQAHPRRQVDMIAMERGESSFDKGTRDYGTAPSLQRQPAGAEGDPTPGRREFCNFVALAMALADFALLLPYELEQTGARGLMTEARLRQTPAWPDNEKVAFKHDAAWIAPRLAQIRERWTQWLTT
jgi:putative spermidine/putrescine transport system substrate-binding protein